LRKHLAKGPRANPNSAERLGRQALSAGLGTLDLAKIHEHALIALLSSTSSLESGNGRVTQAAIFFVEALAPIEKTRRAAVENNNRLNRMNEVLSRRTVELATTNRQLQQEIVQRRAVEKALRESEQHYNDLLDQSLICRSSCDASPARFCPRTSRNARRSAGSFTMKSARA
jgi:hypothetical protein